MWDRESAAERGLADNAAQGLRRPGPLRGRRPGACAGPWPAAKRHAGRKGESHAEVPDSLPDKLMQFARPGGARRLPPRAAADFTGTAPVPGRSSATTGSARPCATANTGPVRVTPGLDGTSCVGHDICPPRSVDPATRTGRFLQVRDAGVGSGPGLSDRGLPSSGSVPTIGPLSCLTLPLAGKDTGLSACKCLHRAILQKQEHSR